MPVLMVSENTSPHVGFSRNRSIVPSSRVMTMPNSTGFSTRFNAIDAERALRPGARSTMRAEIDVGEHVAGDHEERLVELVHRVAHRAGGAERRLLGGVAHAHAELGAVAEVVADVVGEERDRHHDVVEAVLREQPHDVLHHRHVGDRHHRLRLVARERPQPRAFAAGQDHRLHALDLLRRRPCVRVPRPSRSAARAAGTYFDGGVVPEDESRRSRSTQPRPRRTRVRTDAVVASAQQEHRQREHQRQRARLARPTRTSMRRAPASAERDRGRRDDAPRGRERPRRRHSTAAGRSSTSSATAAGDEQHPIGGGVEDLAELAALVEVPGDVAVDPVGRAEHREQDRGRDLVLRPRAARGTPARTPAARAR